MEYEIEDEDGATYATQWEDFIDAAIDAAIASIDTALEFFSEPKEF